MTVVWFLSYLIVRAILRHGEFVADRGDAFMTSQPKYLSRPLMKISSQIKAAPKQRLREVQEMNAFFIIPAVTGGSLVPLFSTHPPVEERIKRLTELDASIRSA